ncbi:MAG: hypothetical protein ACLS85_03555 [Coprobacillus cateniformis]
MARDFYADLDTYKNELLVIHGTNDTTVPFDISKIYVPKFNQQLKFVPIEGQTIIMILLNILKKF